MNAVEVFVGTVTHSHVNEDIVGVFSDKERAIEATRAYGKTLNQTVYGLHVRALMLDQPTKKRWGRVVFHESIDED